MFTLDSEGTVKDLLLYARFPSDTEKTSDGRSERYYDLMAVAQNNLDTVTPKIYFDVELARDPRETY